MIYFLLTLLAIVLFFVVRPNSGSNCKIALYFCFGLIILVGLFSYIKSYLDKALILNKVGYVSISKEEMMDLTPNELKQFIEVNGVYFKVAEVEE